MNTRIEVTPKVVRGLWTHLSEVYGTTVLNKDDSDLMKAVGWALDLMKIQDKKTFMEYYCTTIIKTIYTPFEVGVAEPGWPLVSQLMVGPHENQHGYQYNTSGVSFVMGYLAKKSARAHYEAQAWSCSMEMHFWLYGEIPSTNQLARKILHYGCGQAEVDYIKRFLDMSAEVVKAGGISTHAAQTSIDWLMQHEER